MAGPRWSCPTFADGPFLDVAMTAAAGHGTVPATSHCQFFLARKQRYCRCTPSYGNKFCGGHLIHNDQGPENGGRRIACPLDPRHTCLVAKLDSHLKRCNETKSRQQAAEWITVGLNYLRKASCTSASVRHLSTEELDGFLNRVRSAGKRLHEMGDTVMALPQPPNEDRFSFVFDSPTELGNDNALKHRHQLFGLLSILDSGGLLNRRFDFLEMGAGRGGLSDVIARYLSRTEPSEERTEFLLVDRAGCRHKKDCRHSNDEAIGFRRIRADIADLDFVKLLSSGDFKSPLVCVCKHLCGEALDLALNCIFSSANEQVESVPVVVGGLFATCCHHRCSWRSYCGLGLLNKLGFSTEHDFQLLCSISSWATCAQPGSETWMRRQAIDAEKLRNHSRQWRRHLQKISSAVDDDVNVDNDVDNSTSCTTEVDGGLDEKARERERIGRLAKTILDFGRVDFIRQQLTSSQRRVSVIEYADCFVTPENKAIYLR